MKIRTYWVLLVCLMTLSLVLVSCGPNTAVPTTQMTTSPTVTANNPTASAQTSAAASTTSAGPEETAASSNMPQYGGTLKFLLTGDISVFDEAITPGLHAAAQSLHLTNWVLVPGDWTKGPAGGYGTNDTGWDWAGPVPVVLGLDGPGLAESFEMIGAGHWLFHMQQGVRYAMNAASEASRLVNGREFDANDAAYALKRYLASPGSYIHRSYPGLRTEAVITVPDRWTLEIKVPPEMAVDAMAQFFDFATVDIPSEVIEKYGNMTDWRNSVGTGPFILTDYVNGSAAHFERNPSYWAKDPIGPGKGNQLPYVDSVTFSIIPDPSTRIAALRTGKIDVMTAVSWEDGGELIKRDPELKYVKYPGTSVYTAMRTDLPPFNDVRVRRAMMMSIDFEDIVDSLFGGDAPILTWPLKPNKEFLDAYLGLDDPEMPDSVKELYTYNPEKARQLLAEAGYPDGFKTTVVLPSTGSGPLAMGADYMSVIKDMWSKVGIELELNVIDSGAFASIGASRNYEGLNHGFSSGAEGALYQAIRMRGQGNTNQSYIDDPVVNQAAEEMQKILLTDRTEANRIHKNLMKYVLDQAWMIPGPQDRPYTIWWPWVKNYSGEVSIGYYNGQSWAQFAWVDQDLKKSLGY